MTLTPAQLGALRSLGLVVIMGVLTWLGNTANLNGIVSAGAATLITIAAGALEQMIHTSTGNALFGAAVLRT